MLNKLDLELFKILDSEIDKTLSEWCYINDESWLFKIWDNANIKISSENRFTYITLLTKNVPKVKYLEIQNPNNYFENIPNPTFDILWHYSTTNTLLRYLENNDFKVDWPYGWMIILKRKHINEGWIILIKTFEFDITKEIKEWSDEKKQELINFLKSI